MRTSARRKGSKRGYEMNISVKCASGLLLRMFKFIEERCWINFVRPPAFTSFALGMYMVKYEDLMNKRQLDTR